MVEVEAESPSGGPTIAVDGRHWQLTPPLDITSTTFPPYACASYVWGPDRAPNPIHPSIAMSDRSPTLSVDMSPAAVEEGAFVHGAQSPGQCGLRVSRMNTPSPEPQRVDGYPARDGTSGLASGAQTPKSVKFPEPAALATVVDAQRHFPEQVIATADERDAAERVKEESQ